MEAHQRKFRRVSIHRRPDGERLPLLLEADGCPAHYPTRLLLNLRGRNAAWGTMEVVANDLLLLGHIQTFADLPDVGRRMEEGRYLNSAEVQSIAGLCGVSLNRLRQLNESKVTPVSSTTPLLKSIRSPTSSSIAASLILLAIST